VLETATLLRATAANHRAWFRRGAAMAGGGVERLDGRQVIVANGDGTIGSSRARARAREALDGGNLDGHARRRFDLRLDCPVGMR
jgi:hypothetical protein